MFSRELAVRDALQLLDRLDRLLELLQTLLAELLLALLHSLLRVRLELVRQVRRRLADDREAGRAQIPAAASTSSPLGLRTS